MPIGAIIGGVASLAGGAMQASSARAAADAQTQASREQMELQREVYADQTRRFEPFYQGGQNALAAYQSELGLGAAPDGWQGLSMSPAAQFAMTQGITDVEGGAASRGGLRSGATMAGLERLRFGLAAGDRDNQLNRLAGLADMGQGSAGMQAQAGNAFAQMGSTSLANRGDAQAAGHIGAGNAWGNALGNLSGIFAYQQQRR